MGLATFPLSEAIFHLITAGAWVGGLVPLLMFLRLQVRVQTTSRRLLGCSDGFPRLPPGRLVRQERSTHTWFMTNGLRSFLGTITATWFG
jgi:hypothetical protein